MNSYYLIDDAYCTSLGQSIKLNPANLYLNAMAAQSKTNQVKNKFKILTVNNRSITYNKIQQRRVAKIKHNSVKKNFTANFPLA